MARGLSLLFLHLHELFSTAGRCLRCYYGPRLDRDGMPPTVGAHRAAVCPSAQSVFGWIFAGHQSAQRQRRFGAGLSRTVLAHICRQFFRRRRAVYRRRALIVLATRGRLSRRWRDCRHSGAMRSIEPGGNFFDESFNIKA